MDIASRKPAKTESQPPSIGNLLAGIFLVGLVISSILVYLAFTGYQGGAVRELAQADAERISHLVFEHFYSVMRKGSNREEIDDLVHHIRNQLPDYQVSIIRGDPVIQQFGDRAGQAELRKSDRILAEVLKSGQDHLDTSDKHLRYLFPIKVTGECTTCHSQAKLGDINGVISVKVAISALEAPISRMNFPIMLLTFSLVAGLLIVTFIVLRARVSRPIVDLSAHVADITDVIDKSHYLEIKKHWPKEVGYLATNFNQLMTQVRSSHQQLREMSLRDPLTNLFNRRHFDQVIERAEIDARQNKHSFAILLIDLDRFKPINDRFGHAAGDVMLIGVSQALQSALRGSDLAARIGGDEFALLAHSTDFASACELAERVRNAIAKTSFRFGNETVHASCSIGVACYPESGERAVDLLRAADAAMYANKAYRQTEG